jgi:hypothetical protein
MAKDSMMSQLRDANPARQSFTRNDELKARIMSAPTPWGYARGPAHARSRPTRVPAVPRDVSSAGRWWLASAVTAVAVLGLVVAFSLSGPIPSTVQAFPALTSPTVLTPAELGRSLRMYGVGSDNAGLQINKGHPVRTPWGTGYVLSNADKSVLCLVAPGTGPRSWSASCAQTKQASARGTGTMEFAYSSASHSARLIDLVPQGATVTVQTSGGLSHVVKLDDGILAVNIRQQLRLVVSVHGHEVVSTTVSPQDAMSTPSSAKGPGSSTATHGSSTVAAETAP